MGRQISHFTLSSPYFKPSHSLPPKHLNFHSSYSSSHLNNIYNNKIKTKAFNGYIQTCISLLKQCLSVRSLPGGLAVHAHTLKTGVSTRQPVSSHLLLLYSTLSPNSPSLPSTPSDLFSTNLLISAHVRRGNLLLARQVFDRMTHRNDVSYTLLMDAYMKEGSVFEASGYFEDNPKPSVVSWTAAISGFVRNGLGFEALVFFRRMVGSGVMPNEITFPAVLKACSSGGFFDFAESVLGIVVRMGFVGKLSVCNALITLWVRMGELGEASRVFDEMEEKDVVSWTAMLDVYVKMGDLVRARRLFDEMPLKNQVCWSAMIARYSQCDKALEALRLFDRMVREGIRPNSSCFASVINSTTALRDLVLGRSIHGFVVKMGVDGDVFVGSALVGMYCKGGASLEGYCVFDAIPEKNTICWNSMVAGYCCDGRLEEALELFHRIPVRTMESWNALISGFAEKKHYEKALETFDLMLSSGQLPNGSTFSSVLLACASLSSLGKGKNIHGKIIKLGIQNGVFVGTALTDMYAKSGEIESSKKIFQQMPEKNDVCWTAMIQGLADNGQAHESLSLFDEMEMKKVFAPTEAMFLSVLYACSHCGLVERAFQYFESMKKFHGIRPHQRHYTCMVDLLARAGRLREAEKFINKMPLEPEANIWAALLSGCSTYNNHEIGEKAAKKLQELDKENSASYVLLSNIYASAGRWKDVVRMRTLMREEGLKKSSGCSWIHVKDKTHSFNSWDVSHQKSEEIYGTLELILSETN